MRLTRIFLACLIGTGALAPAAGAADLMWGRNEIANALPSLGPVGDGRRVWLKLNCYSCHGAAAGGGMGPNIQGADGSDVWAAMLHGDAKEGGMRSFAKYATATDAKNVTAYLHSIGTKNEPTWLDWWNAKP
jgi:mono/diheme cytochrome c family protein